MSSANMGSDKEFTLRGKSFMYILSSRGTTIAAWRAPCFDVP
jgi:hypothetical protein